MPSIMTKLKCQRCGIDYFAKMAEVRFKKLMGRERKYCSRSCFDLFVREHSLTKKYIKPGTPEYRAWKRDYDRMYRLGPRREIVLRTNREYYHRNRDRILQRNRDKREARRLNHNANL